VKGGGGDGGSDGGARSAPEKKKLSIMDVARHVVTFACVFLIPTTCRVATFACTV
jgi:hypothetical protein